MVKAFRPPKRKDMGSNPIASKHKSFYFFLNKYLFFWYLSLFPSCYIPTLQEDMMTLKKKVLKIANHLLGSVRFLKEFDLLGCQLHMQPAHQVLQVLDVGDSHN